MHEKTNLIAGSSGVQPLDPGLIRHKFSLKKRKMSANEE